MFGNDLVGQATLLTPEGSSKARKVIRIQGFLEMSVVVFLIGVFLNFPIFIFLGGILMLIDDLISMKLGVLNPLFPLLFAFILAFIIKPWYMGVFWSMAIFQIFGIPTAFKKIINPNKVIGKL